MEVLETRVDVAFTGCFRANGDGVAGVRSLLGEGTGDRQAVQSGIEQRGNKIPSNVISDEHSSSTFAQHACSFSLTHS